MKLPARIVIRSDDREGKRPTYYVRGDLAEKLVEALGAVVDAHRTGRYEPANAAARHAENVCVDVREALQLDERDPDLDDVVDGLAALEREKRE